MSKLLTGPALCCVLLLSNHVQTQAQTVVSSTGAEPFPIAKCLKNNDDSLKSWTMFQIRDDMNKTVNPGGIMGGSVMEKDSRSDPTKLGYPSPRVEYDDPPNTPPHVPTHDLAHNFNGTLDMTGATLPGIVAILVDDKATLTVEEIISARPPGVTGPVFKQEYPVNGTALWNPRSYKEFIESDKVIPAGRKYTLTLKYENIANLTGKYKGIDKQKVDYDGVSVYVCLLPVEVRDIKDHANTGDDVTITNWDTAQQIADNNIAWIEAHSSATDDAPRMPQLEFNVPGLPQNVTLEAKLLVEYERPYAGKQADDTVRVPANGSFQSVTNGRWQIWNDYTNIRFFGGDATLTYKINGGAEQTIKFAIGGRNPDDARCKTYTQGRPNAPWYAYAIEKHESQAYNPGFYNQFWERSGNSSPINNGVNYQFTRGDALVVRSPGETGVGGTGLAQVTGAGGNKTVSAPREIFWNWQRNVDALMVILAGKIQLAETFMNDPAPRNGPGSMPNGQRPQTTFHTGNNVPVPSRVQGRVTFGDAQGNKRPEDAVAIKAYNGASAHWCSWRGPTVHEWQFNYGQNNYVEQVGNQVEEAQP